MKLVPFLALIFAMFFSGGAFAAAPALSCTDGKGEAEAFRLFPTGKRGVFVGEFLGDHALKEKLRYVLAGKANLEAKYGAFQNSDPVAIFSAPEKTGSANFALAMKANAEGIYAAEYKNSTGSGKLECSVEKKFKRLLKAVKKTAVLPAARYYQLSDTSFAATCVVEGETTPSYTMRAYGRRFGEINLQLKPVSDQFGRGQNYSSLAFGKDDLLVFRSSNKIQISSDREKLARLYLDPKVTKASKAKNAAKLHSVVVVSDLKDPSQPMVRLVCAEEHAFPAIPRFAREALEMPKALPKVPGTRAEIDLSLCEEKNAAEVEKRSAQWGRLLMAMPLPAPSLINSISMSGNYETDHCPFFVVGVSDRAGADAIRALVGDSLVGIPVKLSIGNADALE